jgi:hypothetical protein
VTAAPAFRCRPTIAVGATQGFGRHWARTIPGLPSIRCPNSGPRSPRPASPLLPHLRDHPHGAAARGGFGGVHAGGNGPRQAKYFWGNGPSAAANVGATVRGRPSTFGATVRALPPTLGQRCFGVRTPLGQNGDTPLADGGVDHDLKGPEWGQNAVAPTTMFRSPQRCTISQFSRCRCPKSAPNPPSRPPISYPYYVLSQ